MGDAGCRLNLKHHSHDARSVSRNDMGGSPPLPGRDRSEAARKSRTADGKRGARALAWSCYGVPQAHRARGCDPLLSGLLDLAPGAPELHPARRHARGRALRRRRSPLALRRRGGRHPRRAADPGQDAGGRDRRDAGRHHLCAGCGERGGGRVHVRAHLRDRDRPHRRLPRRALARLRRGGHPHARARGALGGRLLGARADARRRPRPRLRRGRPGEGDPSPDPLHVRPLRGRLPRPHQRRLRGAPDAAGPGLHGHRLRPRRGHLLLGYFLFEVPSNLIMHRVGARVWMARIMISWGVISAAMMLVRGATSFYALRFLLGAAEAGFFPGMILYLTYWFPAAEQARAVARFMTATAMAGVVGGPISGAILVGLGGRGGLAGWQWLFLLEGLPAVAFGLAVLVYLTDRPEMADWLAPE